MILRTQNREIFNLDLCYRIYCDEEGIFAQLEAGERYMDYVLGVYKNSKRVTEIFDEMFSSMKNGENFFAMPKE